MNGEQYCTLSALKIAVAKYHLGEFERLLPTGSRAFLNPDPETATAPLHGHADGAIFETFAAFDTFSCAVAHRLGFKGADGFSMKRIAADSRVPRVILRRASDTFATDRWKRLESLRNLAGHRGVVSQYLVSAEHLGGFKVYLPDGTQPTRRGDEFLPVMIDLLRWSEGRLRFMFNGVCRDAFTRRGRMLQLRGSKIRVELLDR